MNQEDMVLDMEIKTADPVHVQIEGFLRRKIERGELPQGIRLPSTAALASRWGVQTDTIQRAFARLVSDGLVERHRRRGTFVRAATAKATIGLLFGPTLADEGAHFYRAVLKGFRAELDERDHACRVYDGLTGTTGTPLPPDADLYRQLDSDLRNNRFAGLIEFAPGVQPLGDWQRRTTLPRVRFEPSRPDDNDARFDSARFGREVVEYLARHGRRRLAYLIPPVADPPIPAHEARLASIMAATHDLGLPPPICIAQSTERFAQGAAYERDVFNTAMEMIAGWSRLPVGERPDALLSGDDIVTRAVSLALLHSGVRVPEELMVVTLANEDVDLHYGIPVVRYEFSPRELARELVGLLWKRMQGEPLPTLPIVVPGKMIGDSR